MIFWIGTTVFIIGMILRIYFKWKYYRDYMSNAHTDLQKQEMKSKYRPKIFIGLGIEVAGCIISVIGLIVG